jgi:hypothetical protein
MITPKNRIHRRTLLRGAGGVAIGLPFLSAMLRPGSSHADALTPTRLIVFYSPGGTLLDRWRPTGSETSFTLQPMMSPLAPFQDRLVFVDGVDLSITQLGNGHPHSRGMGGVLTGQQLLAGNYNTNGGNAGFAAGPSIDQVIAGSISDGLRFPSLEVCAGWSTGITAGGQPHPGNVINYQPPWNGGGQAVPVPPATDPLNTLNRIFAGVDTGDTEGAAQVTAWNTSILDGVQEDFNHVMGKLASEDRAKLEAHVTLIRETEEGLQQAVAAGCTAPTNVDPTPGFYDDPIAQGVSRGDSDGGNMSITTGAKVPLKGDVMTDLLVAAMACDLTRVGTMQWSDSEAKFMLGFLNDENGNPLTDHHHGYQHDRGFQPGSLEIIYNFYMSKVAHLLERLDSVDEGNGTMLDNSLVFVVTEIQMPETHGQSNMPFILAGKAGGQLDSGRWLKVNSQPHNNLLVSILNLFGLQDQTFGHSDFCTGPMAGLV